MQKQIQEAVIFVSVFWDLLTNWYFMRCSKTFKRNQLMQTSLHLTSQK